MTRCGDCYPFADENGLSDWARQISNKGGLDPGVGGSAASGGSSSGSGGSCTPVPPGCQNANDRGQAMIANVPATTGIYDLAGQQSCACLVGIGVNDCCAMSYRAIGLHDCAQQSEQRSQA